MPPQQARSVFISHAAADKDMADAVADLLVTGIDGLSNGDVFCSSLEGKNVPTGDRFVDHIKEQVRGSKLVVFLISPRFSQSAFCLCEVGAAWALQTNIFPLLVPPSDYPDLMAVLNGVQSGKIGDRGSLSALRDRVVHALSLATGSTSEWERKRDKFLKELPSTLSACSPSASAGGCNTTRGSIGRSALTYTLPDQAKADLIRVSVSALICIRIDHKYLLVRGSRIKDQFQPVGGVLKYYDSARRTLLNLGMKNDQAFPVDDDSRHDLRIHLQAASLDPFLDWYATCQNREVSPWREFYEELLAEQILNPAVFPYAAFDHLKTHSHGVAWSKHHQCHQLTIAEIYQLLPNAPQQADLARVFAQTGGDQFIWADDAQVLKGETPAGGSNKTTRISETAKWLVDACR